MISQDDAKNYLDLMYRYVDFYKEFIALEKLKMEDLSQRQLERLDQRVREEEAFLLRAKGMEQKRTAFLEAYQLNDKKMSEIMPLFPPAYQGDIQRKFDELSGILLDLKEINSRCNTMTELQLKRIQLRIAEMQEESAQQSLRIKLTKKGGKKDGRLSQKV